MSSQDLPVPKRLTRRAFLHGTFAVAGSAALGPLWGHAAFAQEAAAAGADAADKPTIYLIATSHNDTQWNWTVQHTIQDCIPATMQPNWALFEKYPDYVFNYEGVIHYMFFKEYHPDLWPQLQSWVAKGRWRLSGSWINAVDVVNPSPESLFRQALYGQQFFRREFGKVSRDIYLPDCFGFPYSLPSIGRHSGLVAFSTQKFDLWGGWRPTPFDVGRWQGPDGQQIISALKPGAYVTQIHSDITRDPNWTNDFSKAGNRLVDLRYFGTGDQGGTPPEASVAWAQKSMDDHDGYARVYNTGNDQIGLDLTPDQVATLDVYDGELTMKTHGVGGYTSQAAHKKWNRANEQMADAAERASLAAEWLGGPAYPKEILSAAWIRTLWHQFHDELPGTCIVQAYTFVWNDDLINQSQLSQTMTTGVGAVAQHLDTQAQGVPVVVYNPLSQPRRDIIEATVTLPHPAPAVRVFDTVTGAEVPSQVRSRRGNVAEIVFLASAPSIGCRVFDVRPSATPCIMPTGIKATADGLESDRYKVMVNDTGDISSIYDKAAQTELLSSPATLEHFHDYSPNWPAWEILWDTVSNPPQGVVNGNPRVRVVEHGPARVALEVTRSLGDSTFVQTLRLTPGGDWLEIHNDIDWQTPGTLVKATFPFSASNPNATYDLGLGVIERPNADPNRYEVNAQQWADITDTSGNHGAAILTAFKYGFNKPNDNTLRLSIIRTPDGGGNWHHQETNDIGRHYFSYAVAGHGGDWRTAALPEKGARFNQPLRAFQTAAHFGKGGRQFSLASVSTPQVAIRALKRAEDSGEWVVRVQELHGQAAQGVAIHFAGPVESVRELNAAEEPLGTYHAQDGALLFDLTPYQPRTFAVRVAAAPAVIPAVVSTPLKLPFNFNGITMNSDQTAAAFDAQGRSYPAELWPMQLTHDGVAYELAVWPSGLSHDGVAFHLDSGTHTMVSCAGQTIALPAGTHNRLYFLAASSDDEQPGMFIVHGPNGHETKSLVTVQDWQNLIGQWYSRIKDNDPSDPQKFTPGTNDWGRALDNVAVKDIVDGKVQHLDRLKPAFVKRDDIAWIGTHRHGANGDQPYCFCYLFQYGIDLPAGATHVTLPHNPKIRVMAMTAAHTTLHQTVPAGVLFEPEMGTLRITAPAVELPAHYPVTQAAVYQLAAPQTFDGTARGMTVRGVPNLPTDAAQPWTINFYAYTDQQPGELSILGGFGDGRDETGTQRYIIKFDNVIHFWGSNIDIDSSQPLDTGKWQMLTATYDGKTVTLYKNGVAIGAGAAEFEDASPDIGLGTRGPWDNGHRFAGKIAGFEIWNRPLKAAELQTLLADMPTG